MKRAFRIVKLSSIGVFFTGLISIIQGCTAKEGALAAVLLVLLQFCSGPMLDSTDTSDSSNVGPPAPLIIDFFTDSQFVNDIVCGATPRFINQAISGQTDFTIRDWTSLTSDTGGGTLTLSTNGGSGFLTISVSGGNCNLSDNTVIPGTNHVSWHNADVNFTSLGYSTINLPIENVSGTVTGCRFVTRERGFGSVADVVFDPVAGTSVSFSIVGLGLLNGIALEGCNFIDGSALVLGPPSVE